MLVHGYYPSELLKSTIISLPKDKTGSLSSSSNYRGISLFNSICKLYDYVIIDIWGDSLDTCDMQYGFKKKHSTTLCTVVLKELVQHYREGNSDVYCCLLDASKAFDRIHYGELFTLLLSTKMPVKILRLIIDSYVRQSTRISWDNVYTNYFQLLNGVKQGGLLSAKLFTLYIDGLFTELKQTGYGCHINNTYMGALSYADDIILSCPSIRGLNRMIKICSIFANSNHITFNCKKTVCIKFGGKKHDYEHLTLNGNDIEWVSEIKHLGNNLNISRNDELDCQIKTSHFIGYVNKLIVNFGHLRGSVLNKLFKLYCCSFYGSQMWKLGSVYFNKVCTAWNIAVRKICNLPYTTHRWFLGPLMNQPHISYQLQKRCIHFLHNMKTSQNEIVLTCYRNAVRNANTPIGHNIAFLRNTLGIDIDNNETTPDIRLPKVYLTNEQGVLLSNIKMLIAVRNGDFILPYLSSSEIECLITDIATM